MSQPIQVSASGDPGGQYSIIDNGPCPITITANGTTSNNWSPANVLGFDNMAYGAIDQGINYKPNGTIPDFVNKQTSILNNPMSATIGFRNPS